MGDVNSVVNNINQKVAKAFSIALYDTVEELKKQSYVGATNQLRSGWDHTNPVISDDKITASITNDSSHAINRIAGRSRGKPPPIDPIELWVKKKLKLPAGQARGVAFAISKKIAKEGTNRYKSKDNFMDLDVNGKLKINSRFEEMFLEKFRSAYDNN